MEKYIHTTKRFKLSYLLTSKLTLNLLYVSVCIDKYTHILMYQLELILLTLKLKTQFQNNQETFFANTCISIHHLPSCYYLFFTVNRTRVKQDKDC